MKSNPTNTSFLLQGAFASFGTYFCMYAFRKPFAVATFENLVYLGIDFKILLIISQVLGYALSKFIAIKLISELRANQRLGYLITMILSAEVSLVFFGWVPAPFSTLFMLTNGLSLGMIWGIVFSYLEGRRFTEILGVALCSSFILSSGAVKSVGLLVMNDLGVSEFWMPAVTGAIFLVPFIIFANLLEKMKKPTAEDIRLQTARHPMSRQDRKNVFYSFFFPILILVLFYISLTALRDFRDNFSRELWDSLGFRDHAAIYTYSEIPIALLVLMIMGAMSFVKGNHRALMYYHYLLILGTLIIGLGTFLYQKNHISPMIWMISTGFGLYTCYVPFNGIFFDRMIATFRINGNAGFLIYIADAFGYLGSMAVLLYKNFGQASVSWLQFFINCTYLVAALGCSVSFVSLVYFNRRYTRLPNRPEREITIL